MTNLTKLTAEEKTFAAENHHYVYSFLRKYGLSEDDYYDTVIFGYLRAVQRYLSDGELRDKYAFSTVTYGAMRSELANKNRAALAKKRSAVTVAYNDDEHGGYSDLSDMVSENEAVNALIARMTGRQARIISLKADGYTLSEIGCICGVSASCVSREIACVRKNFAVPEYQLAAAA